MKMPATGFSNDYITQMDNNHKTRNTACGLASSCIEGAAKSAIDKCE